MDSSGQAAVFLGLLTLTTIAIALAFLPASIAKKKGYSYGGFWLFGFTCFLPALIVALVISKKSEIATDSRSWGTSLSQNNAQVIRELKELLDIGAITQEEFTIKKRELLNLPSPMEEEAS